MPPSVLDAKLHPPLLRRNLTQRPRLHKLLDAGIADHHRLFLLCAPAGYGKTTLVAGWLATVKLPVAWLSLEEADGDPMQLAMAMAAALQTIHPDFGATMLRRLQPGALLSGAHPPDDRVMPVTLANALVAELSQHPSALLVLDDFHLAASPDVCWLVQVLLDQSPSLTIAMTTRVEPALALPRMRLRNQLTEITVRDLCFSAEETTQFLQQTMQLDTPLALSTALTQRTEGWAGALQLAALSMRGLTGEQQQTFVNSFSGDHRYIADYLSTEVLRQLSAETRHFLLITSPLLRLCAPLCDVLLAASIAPALIDSQTMLESVERQGLFLTALDERRYWYRYHRLFGDLLYSHLQQDHPDLPSLLHRRAAEWHLCEGDADAAMHHALQTGDNAFAADIAQQFGVQMIGGSRLGSFLRWLHALDAREVARRPYVLVGAAWTHVLTGDRDEALRKVDLAEAQLADFVDFYSSVDGRTVTAAEVRGHINAVRGYAARLRGDTDSVIHFARRALEDLPENAFTVRSTVALNLGLLENERGDLDAALCSYAEAHRMGMQDAANLFVALSARGLEGEIFLQRGQLYEAAACFQDVLTTGAAASPPPPAIGMGYLGLAQIALLRGAPIEAERLLAEGMKFAQEIASAEAMQRAAGFAVEIALYNDDLAQARRHLATVGVSAQPGADASLDSMIPAVRLALAEGDLTTASAWLAALTDRLNAHPSTSKMQRSMLAIDLQRARVWLEMGRTADALSLLASLEQRAREEWQVTITALLLKARCHLARQEAVSARTVLQEALRACTAQDAAGLVVMERQGLVELLASIATGADLVAVFAARVLALLPDSASTSLTAQTGLVEPLSERESEVLCLMAAGRPNKAIAETLIIAPSTVKTHVNNILGKLGATNRTEAVAKARAMGLLT